MVLHKHYETNLIGRDFVVGDLHGQMDLFFDLLSSVNFDKSNDRVFALGDLIDRGPDSVGLVELTEQPWFYSIMGNHEMLLLLSICNVDLDVPNALYIQRWAQAIWSKYSCKWLTDDVTTNKLPYMKTIIQTFPLVASVSVGDKKIGLIHAETNFTNWDYLINELKTNISDPCNYIELADDYLVESMLWGRTKVAKNNKKHFPVSNIDYVFHGHTIQKEIRMIDNCVYMDLGGFHTGTLGIINLAEFLTDNTTGRYTITGTPS